MTHQIEKRHTKLKIGTPNRKTMQAIFLPGAWGKIPVFMGKNHPTPGAAMAFSHAQNYPPKTWFSNNLLKKCIFCLTTYNPMVYIRIATNKKGCVHYQKGGL